MADVFLSYSRSDLKQAREIAKALEGEGFSVWWDHKIPIGADFQETIEEQIGTAKSVIVLWSQVSVKSRWVRSEASEAEERGMLLPVRIEAVRVPIAFRLNQTESLSDWTGDPKHEGWQRLILQVAALSEKPAANLLAPPPESPGNAIKLAGHVGKTGWLNPATLLLISSFLALFFLFAPMQSAGPLALITGLAALVFILFRLAENDLSPQMRALAAQWLVPRTSQVSVRTAEAFNHLFEAVFDTYHLSAKCFVRTAMFSFGSLVTLLIIARIVFGSDVEDTVGKYATLIIYAGVVNISGDYISLWKTRMLLRLYRDKGNIAYLVIIDFIASISVFIFLIFAAVFSVYLISLANGHHLEFLKGTTFIGAVKRDALLYLKQPYFEFYDPSQLIKMDYRILLYCSFITHFLTSIWLWAALIFSPIFRFFVWAKGKGLTAIATIFDVKNAPFAALAYIGAIATSILGLLIWGVGTVAAAIVTMNT